MRPRRAHPARRRPLEPRPQGRDRALAHGRAERAQLGAGLHRPLRRRLRRAPPLARLLAPLRRRLAPGGRADLAPDGPGRRDRAAHPGRAVARRAPGHRARGQRRRRLRLAPGDAAPARPPPPLARLAAATRRAGPRPRDLGADHLARHRRLSGEPAAPGRGRELRRDPGRVLDLLGLLLLHLPHQRLDLGLHPLDLADAADPAPPARPLARRRAPADPRARGRPRPRHLHRCPGPSRPAPRRRGGAQRRRPRALQPVQRPRLPRRRRAHPGRAGPARLHLCCL